MFDAKMFSISDIDESIVITPSVRLDYVFHGNTTSDNGFQRGFGAVRNNFSVDFAIAFKNAKDDGFTRSTLASFPFSTPPKNSRQLQFLQKKAIGFHKILRCALESHVDNG